VRVGILGGTGPAGRGLGARLASVGVEVTIGSRSAERAAEIVGELTAKWPDLRLPLEPGDNETAAASDIVVVATPWDSAAPTAGALAGHLAGKVVISMANAIAKVGQELQPLILPRGSVAEELQAHLPGATVAAAFHHLPARELAKISEPMEGDVLVCSDHVEARAVVADLVARMPDLRSLNAGSLANAAAIEAFTAVVLNLNIRYRTRAALRLAGIDATK
jgi:8-hydroxy-5-deazaflavin:NADPH oxidoreductase